MSIEIGSAVSAGMAVLAALGAVFAWWRSNLSKAAKGDAEAARDRAVRELAAAEAAAEAARESAVAAAASVAHLETMAGESRAQSGSLGRIAEATARRPLVAEHKNGVVYRLRNNTAADMVLEQVDNRAKFVKLDWLEQGTVIPAGESVEFRAGGSGEMPMPSTLFLGMVGEDGPRSVEMPARPPKPGR